MKVKIKTRHITIRRTERITREAGINYARNAIAAGFTPNVEAPLDPAEWAIFDLRKAIKHWIRHADTCVASFASAPIPRTKVKKSK